MENIMVMVLMFFTVKIKEKNMGLEHKNIIAASLAVSVTGLLALIQFLVKTLIEVII